VSVNTPRINYSIKRINHSLKNKLLNEKDKSFNEKNNPSFTDYLILHLSILINPDEDKKL
jgi:hypothetical protein